MVEVRPEGKTHFLYRTQLISLWRKIFGSNEPGTHLSAKVYVIRSYHST